MPCYEPRDHEARESETHNGPLAEMLCGVLKALSEDQVKTLAPATQGGPNTKLAILENANRPIME